MSITIRHTVRALAASAGAVAILFTAACGGGENSPEDLGKAVAEAVTAKDTEGMRELVCEAKKGEVQDYDFAKNMPEGFEDVQPTAEFIGVENQTDDRATIKLKVKFENLPPEGQKMGLGDGIEFPVPAIKEDGNWVLCE